MSDILKEEEEKLQALEKQKENLQALLAKTKDSCEVLRSELEGGAWMPLSLDSEDFKKQNVVPAYSLKQQSSDYRGKESRIPQ